MFSRERWVVTLLNLLAEGEEVHFISIEGALESSHLQGRRVGGEEFSALKSRLAVVRLGPTTATVLQGFPKPRGSWNSTEGAVCTLSLLCEQIKRDKGFSDKT